MIKLINFSYFKRLIPLFINKLRFLKEFFESFFLGWLYRNKYRDIKSFCLFLGYPRSGHSIIGAILDAHPNIVMAMEKDILWYFQKGFKRYQLFYILKKNAYLFAKIRNNIWTGYSYKVPNSWQGRYSSINVIGDKQGGRTSLRLLENPNLLNEFRNEIATPIKIVHVARNPFDMITTAMYRKFERREIDKPDNYELLPIIRGIFKRAEAIKRFISENQMQIQHIYHEDFIKNPKKELIKLFKFLDIEYSDGFIENCASIVNPKPHLSRSKIEWSSELISFVEKEINKFPFLERYNFKN
ncbi:MAG: sulfotransferase domain-containing protein [Bacteroidales bacterium]|nr:sulfotransferase domain-containing protein [Bacteroidales bacterium]MBN2817826.1 sulfotransferase domain-containing protein [Bacteroidales bacterium]